MQKRRTSHRISMLRYLLAVVCFLLVFVHVNAQSTSGEPLSQEGADIDQTQGDTTEIPTDEPTIAKGKQLFGQHCSICHGVEKQVIGPALASVHQRRPLPWLLRFIKNSQNVITNTEDEYAQQLFEQFNRQVMPPFEFLPNDDIISILAYIKAESTSSTAYGGVNGSSSAVDKTPNVDDDQSTEAYSQKGNDQQNAGEASTGLSGSLIFGIFAGMMILIGIIFYVASKGSK